MKVVINKSKIDGIIRKYLDDNYYPDYGWSDPEYHKKEFERFDAEHFHINDQVAYEFTKLRGNHGNQLTVYKFDDLDSYFGNKWEPVFISWFEEHMGLNVDNFRVLRHEDYNY